MTIVESILELQHCNNCNNMFTAMLFVRNIIVVKVLVRRNTFRYWWSQQGLLADSRCERLLRLRRRLGYADVAKLPLWMLGVLVLERTAIGTSLR